MERSPDDHEELYVVMIHASLFSGIGGPEVAAAMLGWDNAFHCEINPFGRTVLEYWFPDSKSYDDITKTNFAEWRGKVDVLTGGFPCQPFSYAGKRGGRNDDRYLWPQMLRAIDEIRPTWVVGENVAGITTMVEGGVLTPLGCESSLFQEDDELHGYELEQSFTIERICKDLEGLGYSVQPLLIPAASVGAPHRRDRIFILAHDDAHHTDNGADFRPSGKDEGEKEEERVSERDNLHIVGNSSDVRSEGAGTDKDSIGNGCPELGGDGIHRGRDSRPGDSAEREVQVPATDTDSHPGRPEQDCGREEGVPRIQEGGRVLRTTPRPCGGRTPSDTNCEGREESKFSGRGENQEEGGAGVHDRTERFGPDGSATDSHLQRFNERLNPSQSRKEERFNSEADREWGDTDRLLPEHRWDSFPTVSPVHRGNDGIPFPLDNLTIPQTRWRTESLKAYGNAIVPQVMYRIFQAIEQTQTK